MPSNPFDRMPRESEEAYQAFLMYRDLGVDRSQELAAKQLSKNRQKFGEWSAKFSWVDRCIAWDNHLQRERDRVAVVEARKWERRRLQELEANWDAVVKLRERLNQMLAWPIQRQTTEKGGKTIIIEPAKWSYQTVALVAKTAAEIGAATLLAVGSDPDQVTDAQARALVHEPPAGTSST